MSEEVVLPENEIWRHILEVGQAIDTEIQKDVHDLFVQWLWEHGKNLASHPLINDQKKRKEIVDKYCKDLQKSKRYIYYALQAYEKYPYASFDDVRESFYAETNNTIPLNERNFISAITGKPTSKDGGVLAPLHKGTKGAVETTLKDLIQFILDNKAEDVKVYSGDYVFTFKITDFTLSEVENQTQEIQPVQPVAQVEPQEPQSIQGTDNNENFELVMWFWRFRGGVGNPPQNWIAREMRQAKNLRKIGITNDVAKVIIAWRMQDPFWAQKFSSLGLLVSHAADWILEAQNGITSFEQFLDTHPEFDYRQIPADTEEHTFARANKLKEAIFAARKAGVPVDANDYEKLYNAMKYLKEVKK